MFHLVTFKCRVSFKFEVQRGNASLQQSAEDRCTDCNAVRGCRTSLSAVCKCSQDSRENAMFSSLGACLYFVDAKVFKRVSLSSHQPQPDLSNQVFARVISQMVRIYRYEYVAAKEPFGLTLHHLRKLADKCCFDFRPRPDATCKTVIEKKVPS